MNTCIQKAHSGDFSSIKHTAESAARHGFKSSANLRYVEFLEAFRADEALAKRMKARYPACAFLSWRAFHALRRALDLWCELPEHYAGAVPDAQVPWMDIFELDSSDRCEMLDFYALMERDWSKERMDFAMLHTFFGRGVMWPEGHEAIRQTYKHGTPARDAFSKDDRVMYRQLNSKVQDALQEYGRQFQNEFFVLAPKEAFLTGSGPGDWVTRLKSVVLQAATAPTVAPDDPLVIRFCNQGALVVAAWGDEAAFLNKAVRELNL